MSWGYTVIQREREREREREAEKWGEIERERLREKERERREQNAALPRHRKVIYSLVGSSGSRQSL